MKKLFALTIMAVSAVALSGCFSLVDMEHNKNHLRSFNNGFDSMHNSIDWFFFDLDRRDPNGNYGYVSPNT